MLDILVLSIDIFLFSTYLGVSAYLAGIFTKWTESTIGLWSIGTYGATISVLLVTIGRFPLSIYQETLIRLGYIVAYLSFTLLAIAHQFARRNNLDMFLVSMSSAISALLISGFWTIDLLDYGGIHIVNRRGSMIFEMNLYVYLFLLLLTLTRDSTIIYQSSIKKQNRSYLKSTAITHLISWQFFFWSLALFWIITRANSNDSLLPFLFEFPMLMLLVPILTLGSRPFDWSREGFEPRMIMLLNKQGSLAYSWQRENEAPLILEGEAFSNVEQILASILEDKVKEMDLVFQNAALYMQTDENYVSILVTDGDHPSFKILLSRIHDILVLHVQKPLEIGKPAPLPKDLQWLLGQLLPQDIHHLN